MTKVFIVMGNDFPDAVFSTKAAAENYCTERRKAKLRGTPTIHWCVYEYVLDDKP